MTAESVFSIASTTALVTWLLLAIRPRAAWVQRVAGTIVPAAFAATYVVLVSWRLGRGAGDFNSLAGVAALFSDPWTLLAGWIHYLAFDLLTGVWETRDAARRGIPHWIVLPCLALTFMLGPAGWLLYGVIRSVRGVRGAAA
jgi:hypothetical protein